MQTTNPSSTRPATGPDGSDDERQRRKVRRALRRRSFATLATTSEAGRSHAAGVVYDTVGTTLWVHVMRSSRKARNVAANPHVGVSIPFRRLPVGPPYTIHFQGRARLVAMDDPEVVGLLEQGELKGISGHGALDEPDGVFVRIEPTGTVHSFGLGVPVLDLVRDPLGSGARSVRLVPDATR